MPELDADRVIEQSIRIESTCERALEGEESLAQAPGRREVLADSDRLAGVAVALAAKGIGKFSGPEADDAWVRSSFIESFHARILRWTREWWDAQSIPRRHCAQCASLRVAPLYCIDCPSPP